MFCTRNFPDDQGLFGDSFKWLSQPYLIKMGQLNRTKCKWAKSQEGWGFIQNSEPMRFSWALNMPLKVFTFSSMDSFYEIFHWHIACRILGFQVCIYVGYSAPLNSKIIQLSQGSSTIFWRHIELLKVGHESEILGFVKSWWHASRYDTHVSRGLVSCI